MHPKDKIPHHLHKDVVYQCICPAGTCNSSYIEESSRCLENGIREHNTSTISAIYQHSSPYNHPKADISHFKIIDQDNKQVSSETQETIHIRRTNPALSCNVGKMYIPHIFNHLLGTINRSSADISTNP